MIGGNSESTSMKNIDDQDFSKILLCFAESQVLEARKIRKAENIRVFCDSHGRTTLVLESSSQLKDEMIECLEQAENGRLGLVNSTSYYIDGRDFCISETPTLAEDKSNNSQSSFMSVYETELKEIAEISAIEGNEQEPELKEVAETSAIERNEEVNVCGIHNFVISNDTFDHIQENLEDRNSLPSLRQIAMEYRPIINKPPIVSLHQEQVQNDSSESLPYNYSLDEEGYVSVAINGDMINNSHSVDNINHPSVLNDNNMNNLMVSNLEYDYVYDADNKSKLTSNETVPMLIEEMSDNNTTNNNTHTNNNNNNINNNNTHTNNNNNNIINTHTNNDNNNNNNINILTINSYQSFRRETVPKKELTQTECLLTIPLHQALAEALNERLLAYTEIYSDLPRGTTPYIVQQRGVLLYWVREVQHMRYNNALAVAVSLANRAQLPLIAMVSNLILQYVA